MPPVLGKEAVDFAQSLMFDVGFQQCEGLRHWYSAEMLRDIILFLQRRLECNLLSQLRAVK